MKSIAVPFSYSFRSDDNDRFDKIGRFVFHQHQRFFDVFKAVEFMRDQLGKIELAACDEASEFFHSESAAGHETAVDLFVSHTDAPFDARNLNPIAGAEVVDVSDFSAGF